MYKTRDRLWLGLLKESLDCCRRVLVCCQGGNGRRVVCMHVYIPFYTNTPWATLRPFLVVPTPNGSFDFAQLRVKSQLAGPGIGKTNDCMHAGDDDTLCGAVSCWCFLQLGWL
jgi:hypothetical protein